MSENVLYRDGVSARRNASVEVNKIIIYTYEQAHEACNNDVKITAWFTIRLY